MNGSTATPRQGVAALGLLAAGALALRVWVLGYHPHIEADGYYYVTSALRLRAGEGVFHPLFHPLYPILIAWANAVVADPERAARLVSAVAGALTVLPAWFLARSSFGPRVAAGTALLVAVHPLLLLQSTSVQTEATYTLLVTTAAAATLAATESRAGWALPLVGLALGAAYLCRPEGLLLLPVLIAWWLIATWPEAPRRGPALLWAGGCATVAGLASLPYLRYLRATTGHWTLSGKVLHNLGQDSRMAVPPGGDLANLLAQAPEAAGRYARNIFVLDKYALPALLPAALMALLALGLLAVRPQGRDRRAIAFLFSLGLPALVVPLFHIEARVFAPYLPAAMVLAARGAGELGARFARGPRQEVWIRRAALGIVALALLPHALRPLLTPEPRERIYRTAAAWLAAHVPEARRIMDRKPYVAYYSRRDFEPIPPRGDVAGVVAEARRRGVDLLVIDVALVREDRPGVESLAHPALAPPELELLHAVPAPQGPPLLLYRLKPS
ncbi:MAG TPA: glycosyltransferase family 39 protein [Candidatus Methylomirabilis sp.]